MGVNGDIKFANVSFFVFRFLDGFLTILCGMSIGWARDSVNGNINAIIFIFFRSLDGSWIIFNGMLIGWAYDVLMAILTPLFLFLNGSSDEM